MTVTVKGRDTSQPPTGTDDGFVRTYQEAWKVVVTTQAEANAYTVGTFAAGAPSADGGPSCPFLGEVHYADPSAWCRNVSVSCTDPWAGWRYTATYSSEYELSIDPTDEPARISTDGEKFERPFVTDYNGDWIANSAGDPYDPPIMLEDARRIITIERNFASGIPSWFLSYENAVNSDAVTIGGLSFTARQLKMDVLRTSTTLTRNGIDFVTLSVSFHAKNDTWDIVTADLGYEAINDSGKKEPIRLEGSGEYASSPQQLDGSGKAVVNPDLTTVVFRTDRGYPELPFATILSALGL